MNGEAGRTPMRWDPDTYARAWQLAAVAHQGQTYGGPEPEQTIDDLCHIGSVAMEVMGGLWSVPEYDAELALCCAVLHDLIEDTEFGYEHVRTRFGVRVADGVQALSKDPSLPTKAEQMRDSLARIQAQPKEVWMVKLADRITNLYHPPFYWDAARIEAYRAESIELHRVLEPGHRGLAARLMRKIEAYPGGR